MDTDEIIRELNERMLVKADRSESLDDDVFAILSETLQIDGIQKLKDNKIYFNVLKLPASICTVEKEVPLGSKIITIDLISITIFDTREKVAIILHEIGHALYGPTEEVADNYAFEMGFRNEIISSLTSGILNKPEIFKTESNLNRLTEALKENK